MPTRNEHTDPRANEPTQSMRPATLGIAEVQLTLFGQWIRSTYDVSRLVVQFQRAGLDANLRVLEAAADSSRAVLDAWLEATRQARNALLGMSGQAERVLQRAEQNAQHVSQAMTSEAERVARKAEAVAERHQQQLEDEQERARRERARQSREEARQRHEGERAKNGHGADRPTINVVKRDDDWAVIRENASRATGVFDTKREAVARARELARRDDAEVNVEPATQSERNSGHDSGKHDKSA